MDVWADERALYIWSGEKKADLAPLKAAKEALGIVEKIRPFGVPMPGGNSAPQLDCDRILAIGVRPPWVCDYALVSERTAPAGWQAALAYCLHLTDDSRATTVLDILNSVWPGTREISEAELESERKLAEYQHGGS